MIPSVKFSILYENRYCNQDEFDIYVFEGRSKSSSTNEVFTISCPDLKTSVECSLISAQRKSKKPILIGSDAYLLHRDCHNTFDVYSKNTKNFKELKSLNKQLGNFSVCSFMSSVYVIGGVTTNLRCSEICYKYDKINDNWRQIASLNFKTNRSSCSVFKGKIVVTGGYYGRCLNSVESFDHHENKWNILPDMVLSRFDHSSVAVGNKLFVIGGSNRICSEVYDSISRKFTMFSLTLLCSPYKYNKCKTMSFNNKLVVFCGCFFEILSKINVYNVDEQKQG